MSDAMTISTAPSENTTKLDTILDDSALVLETIEGLGGAINPGVPAVAALTNKILRILSAGVKAHERITGQPLDLTQLHHIELVP